MVCPKWCLLGIWVVFWHAQSGWASRHFKIEKLSDGVYAAIHIEGGDAICNAGIVDLGEKTLVFDPFISPLAAHDLLKAAQRLTGSPVVYVVNSHFHNDHIRGNQVFAPGATVIATSRTRSLIAQHEPRALEAEKHYVPKQLEKFTAAYNKSHDAKEKTEFALMVDYYRALSESIPHVQTVLPVLTFEKELTLYGTRRNVRLVAFEKGHTESDLIMVVPGEEIVFTGDLLFIDGHPWLADGFPESWIDILKVIRGMNPTKVVPGHGPVGSHADIDNMIHYIQSLEHLIRQRIQEGRNVDTISPRDMPKPFKHWHFHTFLPMNVRFMADHIRKDLK